MDEIINVIKNEDLSLDELGDLLDEILAKIYSKLKDQVGMGDPIGVIMSMGREAYHVDVRFIDSMVSGSGELYETVYHT